MSCSCAGGETVLHLWLIPGSSHEGTFYHTADASSRSCVPTPSSGSRPHSRRRGAEDPPTPRLDLTALFFKLCILSQSYPELADPLVILPNLTVVELLVLTDAITEALDIVFAPHAGSSLRSRNGEEEIGQKLAARTARPRPITKVAKSYSDVCAPTICLLTNVKILRPPQNTVMRARNNTIRLRTRGNPHSNAQSPVHPQHLIRTPPTAMRFAQITHAPRAKEK
ncbi:unnamed protein product [Trichogramma brassicae]|uniref:Uncharacterized protein n=1 Tax=Trichogramma brassicae TaxID=86971 RepID=A0A6H5HT18_9HYME|nr:unnamed protein product [Trichogramma brassicae]